LSLPSIIDWFIRPPVDTNTTRLGVLAGCSREHREQGSDRCKSRLASCFCQGHSRTTAGNTKRDSPCTFPARCCATQPAFTSGSDTSRVDTRHARKPWGASSASTHPTLPTTSFSPVAAVTREKVVHRRTCRKHPDASRRRNHVARTWRGGRRIFLLRKVRAITTGTLGKRPLRPRELILR
jgi:hypothetical protein